MKNKSIALWLVALGPLAMLILGYVYGAWQEYRAWQEVRQVILAEVTRARSQNDPWPLDRARARQDRNPEISQIELMASALHTQAQGYDLSMNMRMSPLAAPGDADAWPEAPLVEKVMADAEPMFAKLERVLKAHESSREPWSGELDQLLELSFYYSFYSKDLAKAQRALSLMAQTKVTDHVLYRLVALSLRYDQWNSEQLDELADLILKPLDIPERLQASRRDSQRMVLSWFLAIELRWSPELDSVYLLRILEASRRPDGIIGAIDLSKSIELLEQPPVIRRTGGFSMATSFFSNKRMNSRPVLQQIPKLAFELGVVENYRRLVSVAVAVKQFQIKRNRWPDSLDELVDEEPHGELVITDVDGQLFAYSDETMSQHAVLWQPSSNFIAAMQPSPDGTVGALQAQLNNLDLPRESNTLLLIR